MTKPTTEEQFKLNLHEPFKNNLIRIKDHFREILLRKRYDKIINDTPLWISIAIGATSAAIEIYSFFQTTFWPQKIPLFLYGHNQRYSLQPSNFLLSIPIITIITLIIQLYITKNWLGRRDNIQRIMLFTTTAIVDITLLLIYLYIKVQI